MIFSFLVWTMQSLAVGGGGSTNDLSIDGIDLLSIDGVDNIEAE